MIIKFFSFFQFPEQSHRVMKNFTSRYMCNLWVVPGSSHQDAAHRTGISSQKWEKLSHFEWSLGPLIQNARHNSGKPNRPGRCHLGQACCSNPLPCPGDVLPATSCLYNPYSFFISELRSHFFRKSPLVPHFLQFREGPHIVDFLPDPKTNS